LHRRLHRLYYVMMEQIWKYDSNFFHADNEHDKKHFADVYWLVHHNYMILPDKI
jgi:hypothetical protein